MQKILFFVLACTLTCFQTTSAEPAQGKEYRLVQPAAPTSSGEKIEVIDFFAYTCAHCLRLAPLVDRWAQNLPQDVALKRVPVAWDESTLFLSRIYYTFISLNRLDDLHMTFWQDLMQGKITSADDLDGWVKEHGIDADTWNKAYQSFSVAVQTQQSVELWQAYQLDATPYIGVAGKYLTAPFMAGSRQKTFEIVDWLIDKERQERKH